MDEEDPKAKHGEGDGATLQLLATPGFSLLLCVIGVAAFGCIFPGENNDPSHVLAWQGAFFAGFAVVHIASYARLPRTCSKTRAPEPT